MAFCSKCGVAVRETDAFCSACGCKVEPSETDNPEIKAEDQAERDGGQTATATATATATVQAQADKTEYDPADIQQSKTMAALAYLGILFWLPLVVCPGSRYGRFHANQGLLFLITNIVVWIVVGLVNTILGAIFSSAVYIFGIDTGVRAISGLGLVLVTIVSLAAAACMVLLLIQGVLNALNGKAEQLPYIGTFDLLK